MTEQHFQPTHASDVDTQSATMGKVGALLSEIAVTASTIEQLATEIVSMGNDASRASAMADAIRYMAQRVGWFADLGMTCGGVGPTLRGDAETWMAPCAYLLEPSRPA